MPVEIKELIVRAIIEPKKEKAVEVLDECLAAIPERNIPFDYFMLSIAENYYRLGEYEKGNAIMGSLVDRYENDLRYYVSLKGAAKKSVKDESDRARYILQQIIMMTNDRYKEAGMQEGMQDRFTSINSLLMNVPN